MSFDVERAIRNIERREHLRDAEQNAAWVIRRSKMKRIPSKNERETPVRDAMSCLHGASYTMTCSKCRRTTQDAHANLIRLRQKLSIT
jgi:hypothetical protein